MAIWRENDGKKWDQICRNSTTTILNLDSVYTRSVHSLSPTFSIPTSTTPTLADLNGSIEECENKKGIFLLVNIVAFYIRIVWNHATILGLWLLSLFPYCLSNKISFVMQVFLADTKWKGLDWNCTNFL